jgi:hypothetical protein
VILDTGLAIDGLRPNRLDVVEHPVAIPDWGDSPDPDDDDSLDPAAGHGTFIAGLIEMLTPGWATKPQSPNASTRSRTWTC